MTNVQDPFAAASKVLPISSLQGADDDDVPFANGERCGAILPLIFQDHDFRTQTHPSVKKP